MARPGRGRGHRLQRRDLRQLPRGGAPVPAPLRRPGRRASRSCRRRSSTPSSRPATAPGARRAVGLPDDRPVVLFVGRIQPLKGPDVAIRALAAMTRHPTADAGDRRRRQRRRRRRRGCARPAALVAELGVADRVRFVAPQPHHILSSYYRAADVVIVPEPQRELRARRARGRGVRHPGRRQRGRRAAQHRPRRRDRLPRRRS